MRALGIELYDHMPLGKRRQRLASRRNWLLLMVRGARTNLLHVAQSVGGCSTELHNQINDTCKNVEFILNWDWQAARDVLNEKSDCTSEVES